MAKREIIAIVGVPAILIIGYTITIVRRAFGRVRPGVRVPTAEIVDNGTWIGTVAFWGRCSALNLGNGVARAAVICDISDNMTIAEYPDR